MTRAINEAGLALIKQSEGCKLDVYLDGNGFKTVGYGHKVTDDDDLDVGDSITQAEADEYLSDDLQDTEDEVTEFVTADLNDNEFSALVSFTFNEGSGRLKDSTLLVRLNEGDFKDAANEFLRWVFIGKQVSEGLTRRRQAERELFLTPVNEPATHNID
jgi:lysozyme